MNINDRMKAYEGREAGRRCMPLLPICARIDGKRFSRWTSGLARPYDERLSRLMQWVTKQLVSATHARVGYTQSDEISLVFHAERSGSQVYMDGRIQKLTSVLASMATAWFNAGVIDQLPERREHLAVFDCRVWTVPTLGEAANVLLWRERDATKNAISMAVRSRYSHGEVEGKSTSEQRELLAQVGVDFDAYPRFFTHGSFFARRTVERPFSAEELEGLPPRHEAHADPELRVTRTEVQALELPPLDAIDNRVEALFEGAVPTVSPVG